MGRWTTRLAAAFGILFAVALVALGGIGGYLYWNRTEIRAEQQASQELPPLAAQQIPLILGFDYQTVERSRTEVYNLMTPDFRRQYEEDTTKNVIPQARDRQVVSQVNVVGSGMLSAQRDSGSVLVFMNRTVTDKSKTPVYDGSRLRVDYQKIDGKWLIKDIKLL
ncbi:MAG: Mce-associated rane protein [Mycobacterium sp.]|jgi:Mce-associated membrane protein|nr:Mce-associated rane protein [Mycobacterium sp.]